MPPFGEDGTGDTRESEGEDKNPLSYPLFFLLKKEGRKGGSKKRVEDRERKGGGVLQRKVAKTLGENLIAADSLSPPFLLQLFSPPFSKVT